MSRTTPPSTAGKFAAVSRAFGRAVVSQFHPRMLLALLLPFAVVLVGSVVLIWAFWQPVTDWLSNTVFNWPAVAQVDQWLVTLGLISLKIWLAPLLAAALLLPASGILGVAIAAVFVMPLVLRHLKQSHYGDVAEKGRLALIVSGWNAIWVLVVFALGWLFTMPLWLLPPLAVILPILWWTFAFTRMLRLDALADFATADERRQLLGLHMAEFWTLGLICALLSLLPPAWFFLPVFSSLLFAHFSLDALRDLRARTLPPAAPAPTPLDPPVVTPLPPAQLP
ncbi:EI24 domain-containing protein [Achromobacter sp. GG226]|uniref:EI24 domain-containing protein n=1 Tax=Verticiella alkaliphila TaxID=2779529 RepID=UPI001C0D4440|nr:EI24 domain-containing protein [Verticiella sp. GG226]MBU4610558.1 EI24 domain-containing protein [Verticiella sp. GG226]